ncbi:hypothetical protein KKJ17_20655, partial [Xenorhabdus bovienii]
MSVVLPFTKDCQRVFVNWGGVELQALGIDTVEVIAVVNGKDVDGKLREVLHVLGIGVSFFFNWLCNISVNGRLV